MEESPPTPQLYLHPTEMRALVKRFVMAHRGVRHAAKLIGCSPTYLSQFLHSGRGGQKVAQFFHYNKVYVFRHDERKAA